MKSATLILAAISAIATAGAGIASFAKSAALSRPSPARRIRTSRYPEQSARQALRGMRRAQGGPGLLRMPDGSYVPRNTFNAD